MAEANVNEDELRERAEKKVKERMALIGHATSYLIINLFLWGLWLVLALTSDPHDWSGIWPIWVTLGWGIGLAFHAFNYFTGVGSESKREEQVQREMEKMRGQK